MKSDDMRTKSAGYSTSDLRQINCLPYGIEEARIERTWSKKSSKPNHVNANLSPVVTLQSAIQTETKLRSGVVLNINISIDSICTILDTYNTNNLVVCRLNLASNMVRYDGDRTVNIRSLPIALLDDI